MHFGRHLIILVFLSICFIIFQFGRFWHEKHHWSDTRKSNVSFESKLWVYAKCRRKKQVPWATTLYFRGVQSKQASITRAKYMCLNTISSCYYFYRKENNFSSLKNTIVSLCSCYLFLHSLLFFSLSNPISNTSGSFLHKVSHLLPHLAYGSRIGTYSPFCWLFLIFSTL